MLDLNIFEESRVLTNEPITIIDYETALTEYQYNIALQFRYVVHRQAVGFYTPVVFDVSLDYTENSATDFTTKNCLLTIAEPFIEGALFMNHTSPFIVDMLKGQEAGFNRKTLLEDIQNQVVQQDLLWYSDWGVPPVTRQSQRIVVYDLEYTLSMLDPQNVVESLPIWMQKRFPHFNPNHIFKAQITAGYSKKTV